MTFHLMCVCSYVIFSSVSVAEWPPSDHMFSMLTICNISYFPVMILRAGFEF